MDVSATEGFRQRPVWLIAVALLLGAQGLLTLRLFTPDFSVDRLLDDAPIVSGRHPLHYYHGLIGAKTWKDRDTSSCYDPAFQAGYPKTPVFDGGSRPAEFFQLIGGTRPASYKFGLAMCCLLVPLAFIAMGRGIGLSPRSSCLSGLLGCLLWWSPPCQSMFIAGDVDLLLGGLCALLNVTWMIRFERMPGLDSWLMLTFFASLAWFTQPLLVVGYFPFLVLFYIWVSARQGPIWHLAIISAMFVSFGVNCAWLEDWARNLWLYLPFGGDLPAPPPLWPTIARQWSSLLPTDPVYIAVGAAGLAGLVVMIRTNRASAWLFGLCTVEFVLVAGAGKLWPVLTDFGTEKLLVIAAWCLVLPCAHMLALVAARVGTAIHWKPGGAAVLFAGLAVLASCIDLPKQWSSWPGLGVGLSEDRAATVQTLIDNTTPEGRILWEDRPGRGHGWTAMLAVLTERSFLGGLDAEGRLQHMYARLQDGKLEGKQLTDSEWSDARLRQFFDRYNVGWAVCWSPESIERFRALPFAKQIAEVRDGETGVLFAIDRKLSYFIKGQGQWIQADWQRIAMAEVIPENGEVVLSMHYQSKMRVAPSFVQIEPNIDLNDPIPMIRLRIPGPVARLLIVWDNP